MGSEAEVVVVAVELRVVSPTGYILIHCLQFQVASSEKVIHTYSRHIQETVVIRTVTIEDIVACGKL